MPPEIHAVDRSWQFESSSACETRSQIPVLFAIASQAFNDRVGLHSP